MKKLFLSIALMMLSVFAVFADSPLTSTQFYKAYLDVPVVKQASQSNGVINNQIMDFVSNDMNPIDQRMAVINALGFGHVEVFQKYTEYLTSHLGCSIEDLERNLSPKGTCCFLYVASMALYNQDSFLSEVAEGFPVVDSRICTIVKYIIYAQTHMNSEGAEMVRDACFNRYSGQMDVREKAIDIVWDYMKLYE